MSLLDALNPQQRQAAEAVDGPVLIFAGAGSGKTRALTYRIAHMIRDRGIAPERLLAVTFTNKAADEMKGRIARLVGDVAGRVAAGTFHSICARLLRVEGEAIDVPRNYVIFDDGDQTSLVRRALAAANYDPQQFRPPDILNAISRAKNEMLGPEGYAKSSGAKGPFGQVVSAVYHRYQRSLAENRALDFDDLIMKTVLLLEGHQDVLERCQARWRYILVDEYQDINDAQYRFVHQLAAAHRNICVVGDDDQSIYGWRGANVGLILRFHEDYPEAKVIYLEQNYRSTRRILACANAVISQNATRADKKLWTDNPEGEDVLVYEAINETEEADWAIEFITRLLSQGRRFGDFAILYRTNAMSRNFEESLMEARIPYRIVGGLRFYDRAEVKDLLAYLRLAHNPDDSVSAHRILKKPPRGIGDKTAKMVEALSARREISLIEGCRQLTDDEDLRPNTRQALADFVELTEFLHGRAQHGSVPEMAKLVAEKTGYLDWLRSSSSAEQKQRAENVEEFVNVAAAYEERHPRAELPDFLEHVALMSDIDEAGEFGNQVALMTLHSAKGLEFPVVLIAGLEEGMFPHERSMGNPGEVEEERRLCYVGITRAMESLCLSYCRYRTIYGQKTGMRPSRFLRDFPEEGISWRTPSGRRPAAGSASVFGDDGDSGEGDEDEDKNGGRPTTRVSREAGGRKRIDMVGLLDGARKKRARAAEGEAEESQSATPSGAAAAAAPSGAGGKKVTSKAKKPAGGPRQGGGAKAGNAAKPSAAADAAETPAVASVRPGQRVLHGKFGKGTVVGVEGKGTDAVITVVFEHEGIRKLAAQYAKLDMLD